ncbi:hypothetical protein VNI00_000097 [Paramarasmius palmivorus]|uniref:Uncharacterized protein n=1 Tax=Paramarasmius palmivorus TaxID=297713 RepID=A0AAW0EFG5_9AGAR
MQVLTRGGNGGPVVTLDAVKGQIAIKDEVRDCAQTKCPSIPLSDFTDRTTVHFVTVTYGSQGSLRYVVQDADNGHMELLRYQVTGEMGEDASIKFGTYRAAVEGMTVSRAALGDFVVEQ